MPPLVKEPTRAAIVAPKPAAKAQSPRAMEQVATEAKTAAPTASTVAVEPDAHLLDLETLWKKTVDQIRARRPLIKGWVDSAKVLGQEGRSFLLGFPPEQKTAMDSIAMPRNREFLESLLKEISGRDWALKFSLKEGLKVQATPHDETTGTAAPARKPAPAEATFKDDPLIREALEIFKGEIKPVTE
jgi:hypothetical protein